jgi:hypothetical protein
METGDNTAIRQQVPAAGGKNLPPPATGGSLSRQPAAGQPPADAPNGTLLACSD